MKPLYIINLSMYFNTMISTQKAYYGLSKRRNIMECKSRLEMITGVAGRNAALDVSCLTVDRDRFGGYVND